MQQAVILAGGKGTRLQSRLAGRPKPLAEVAGKTLLHHQMRLLKQFGIRSVLLLISYEGQQIVDHCRAHNDWGLHIDYREDPAGLGTAGSVLAAYPKLEDEFFVLYGDTFMDVDLRRFAAFHERNAEAAATLFLHPNDHPHDSDLVEVDESGHVKAFHPYPHPPDIFLPNLVNAALYVVRRRALTPWRHESGSVDFAKQLFPSMLAQGQTLAGYSSPEYIKDCGTPKRIDQVAADFQSGRVAAASLQHPQAAVFLDRDGTLNADPGHITRPVQFELWDGVGEAVARLNRAAYRTVVVTNQPVLARGDCSPAILKQIHNKLETQLGQAGGYLDRIYYCPHHPDCGYPGEVTELKIVCTCRKPAVGLITQAQQDLNIDLSRSWLIGDSSTDMLAARNAGVRSILVETGLAGADGKFAALPDVEIRDLPCAITFILDVFPRLVELSRPLVKSLKAGDVVCVGGFDTTPRQAFAQALVAAAREAGLRASVQRGYQRGPSARELAGETEDGRGPTTTNGSRASAREVQAASIQTEDSDITIIEGGPEAIEIPGELHRPAVTIYFSERAATELGQAGFALPNVDELVASGCLLVRAAQP